jgi:hypothetical protein
MNLESPKVILEQPAKSLFNSLAEVKNFEKLMPDSIVKFDLIDENSFVFGLKGMPEIQLTLKEKVMPNKLVFGSVGDKLPFTLTTNINSLSENKSEVQMIFNGEFNAMMAMMIKSPLSKFIETLTQNMHKL